MHFSPLGQTQYQVLLVQIFLNLLTKSGHRFYSYSTGEIQRITCRDLNPSVSCLQLLLQLLSSVPAGFGSRLCQMVHWILDLGKIPESRLLARETEASGRRTLHKITWRVQSHGWACISGLPILLCYHEEVPSSQALVLSCLLLCMFFFSSFT